MLFLLFISVMSMVLKQIYYNLYQTQIRKDIQSNVYHKEHFTMRVFGKDYF